MGVTADLNAASKNVDIAVYSAVVGQVNAALAQKGQYSSALRNANAHREFLGQIVEPNNSEQARLLGMYDQHLDDISNVLENQMQVDVTSVDPRSARSNRLDETALELYHLRSAKQAACSIM